MRSPEELVEGGGRKSLALDRKKDFDLQSQIRKKWSIGKKKDSPKNGRPSRSRDHENEKNREGGSWELRPRRKGEISARSWDTSFTVQVEKGKNGKHFEPDQKKAGERALPAQGRLIGLMMTLWGEIRKISWAFLKGKDDGNYPQRSLSRKNRNLRGTIITRERSSERSKKASASPRSRATRGGTKIASAATE